MIAIEIQRTAKPHLYEFFEEVILSGQVPARELAQWIDEDPKFAVWLRDRAQFRQGHSKGNKHEQ